MEITKTGKEINVDKMVDSRGVEFIGFASEMSDGSWRALANVGGAFCIVEVKVTIGPGTLSDNRK